MVASMPHVQIRNVPDDVHRTLKVRAAESGVSLSDYLLRELERLASLPTMDEWLRRVRSRPPAREGLSAADVIREERERRDRR